MGKDSVLASGFDPLVLFLDKRTPIIKEECYAAIFGFDAARA